MTLPQKVTLCAAGHFGGAVQPTPPHAGQPPPGWHCRTALHSKTCTEHNETSICVQHSHHPSATSALPTPQIPLPLQMLPSHHASQPSHWQLCASLEQKGWFVGCSALWVPPFPP